MRVLQFSALVVVALLAFAKSHGTIGIPKPEHIEQNPAAIVETPPVVPLPVPYAGSFSLPIDHSGSHPGNFSNRYWVQDHYYKPGGPIFVYDPAEADGAWFLAHLAERRTFFNKYLEEFSGMGIIWEHRYYGESSPFPINLDTTAEQMQYLTNENSLKDFVVFANQFQWKSLGVSPKQVPWIVIGSSYGGTRAATLRELYPETVFAAYASSAIVQHQKDMSVYYEQVYRGMVHYGLKNCTSYIKKAVDYVDIQLSHPTTAAGIKRQYLGRTVEENSNAGFAVTFAAPYQMFQVDGVDEVLRQFCNYMDAVKPPREESKQGAFYSDRWAAWPLHAELVSRYNGDGKNYCEGPVRNDYKTPNCRLDGRTSHPTMISWTWQSCTEFGFFHPTNVGPHALSSRYNSLQYHQDNCYRQFPDGRSSGLLPAEPQTEKLNAVTGGWNMRPSRVFWTAGQWDPWTALSIFSSEPGAPSIRVTDRPSRECNRRESGRNQEVFGYLLPNSEHSYDFYTGEKRAKKPNAMFAAALRQWLKCFRAGSMSDGN